MSAALVRSKTTLQSAHPATDARNSALRACAQRLGLAVSGQGGRWQAVCHEREGEDLKALLRAQGFADRDFHLYMEYQRGWGFL